LDSPSYVALTRQTGLLKEIQIVANNIANSATSGYRAEGVVFAEMISAGNSEGGSISMTDARVRYTHEKAQFPLKTLELCKVLLRDRM